MITFWLRPDLKVDGIASIWATSIPIGQKAAVLVRASQHAKTVATTALSVTF